MTKKTRESNVYKVAYRYEMLGAKTRKRRLKQDAVPKVPTQSAFKATFTKTIKNSLFAVIKEIPLCPCQEVK